MKNRFIFFLFILVSCSNETKNDILTEEKTLTSEDIYKKYEKSIVLIKNQYYYEVNLGNGEKVYFSEFNDETGSPNIDYTKENILKNLTTIYGTGFFISGDGIIATNRHVISPEIDKTRIKKHVRSFFDQIKHKLDSEITDHLINIKDIEAYYNKNYDYLTRHDVDEILTFVKNEKGIILELQMLLNSFDSFGDFTPSDITVNCINHELAIVINNSHVTSNKDFIGCVPIKFHSEKDLAIIQLKNKKTPQEVQKPIEVIYKQENLSMDENIFMIGFNHGPELATTMMGIKAQFTKGNISQESDGEKIMYSIPSLSGSSGSPVFNQKGELVAINYAGIKNSQSFNFGIPVKHLKNLIDENTY